MSEVIRWLRVNWASVLFAVAMLIMAACVGLVLANITKIAPMLKGWLE